MCVWETSNKRRLNSCMSYLGGFKLKVQIFIFVFEKFFNKILNIHFKNVILDRSLCNCVLWQRIFRENCMGMTCSREIHAKTSSLDYKFLRYFKCVMVYIVGHNRVWRKVSRAISMPTILTINNVVFPFAFFNRIGGYISWHSSWG